jgi:hypothetical protein
LKVLNLVDLEKLSGSWRGSMRLSCGQTLQAAGRKADSLKAYRDVVTDESASESHRRAAREAAAALESGNWNWRDPPLPEFRVNWTERGGERSRTANN